MFDNERVSKHGPAPIRGGPRKYFWDLGHKFGTLGPDFWPQMYIQDGVLAVRVPQGSPFKRRHFSSCAETMGVALLFAHVVGDA